VIASIKMGLKCYSTFLYLWKTYND